jgi:hypothetical protein
MFYDMLIMKCNLIWDYSWLRFVNSIAEFWSLLGKRNHDSWVQINEHGVSSGVFIGVEIERYALTDVAGFCFYMFIQIGHKIN